MLSERNQSEKVTYGIMSFVTSEKNEIIARTNKLVIARVTDMEEEWIGKAQEVF